MHNSNPASLGFEGSGGCEGKGHRDGQAMEGNWQGQGHREERLAGRAGGQELVAGGDVKLERLLFLLRRQHSSLGYECLVVTSSSNGWEKGLLAVLKAAASSWLNEALAAEWLHTEP